MSTNKANDIIDAARELFTMYGFTKTTMTDIAGRLNMSKASLYYYFKDKETIFNALRERELEQFTEEINKITGNSNDAKSKLLEYTKKEIKLLQKLLTLRNLVSDNSLETKPLSSSSLKDFNLKERNFVKDILQKGILLNEFKAFNIDEYTELYLVVLEGLRNVFLSTSEKYGNRSIPFKVNEQLNKQSILFTEMFLHSISKE